jgi:lysozyme
MSGIQGIDVSKWQGTVDWSEVASSGCRYGIARAAYGSTIDTSFSQNWSGIAAAGLYRGAYQFYRNPANVSVSDQISAFKSAFGSAGYGTGELPPAIDVESNSTNDAPLTTQAEIDTYVAGIQTWLDSIEQWSGYVPMIYTTASYWSQLGNPTGFGGYPLWVANYGVATPTLPEGWTTYTFWQYSDTGTVPGVAGSCDQDVFNGNQAQLKALTKQDAAVA